MHSQEFINQIVEIRRDLHKIPEIAFNELETSKYIRGKLIAFGFVVESVAKTGLIAYLENREVGNTVCFRADMDALNVLEETGQPYSSCNGNMHACGHDAHMAILLGLAKYMADKQSKKNVVLLFQPGEENVGGAEIVMNDPNFKKHNIESIYGLHIQPELTEGKIGLKSGPFMAQTIELDISILGASSHGAQPHKGIDSIYVASQLINSYQSIISRNISPLESAVLTIGKIVGGQMRNSLAQETKLEGTLRTFNEGIYEQVRMRINEVNEGLEKMYNVKIEAEFMDYCPPVVNDDELYHKVIDLLDKDEVVLMEPMTIAEDFGFYQRELRGLFFMLGCKNICNGYKYPLHSSKFCFDEKVLFKGIDVFTRILENIN